MSLDLCLKQLHVVHIKVFHRMQYIRLLLFYSVIFQSVIFSPSFSVRHFPVLQIPSLRLRPSFSSPANSNPATSSVIFQSCKFQSPVPRTHSSLGHLSCTVDGRLKQRTSPLTWFWTHPTGISPAAEDTSLPPPSRLFLLGRVTKLMYSHLLTQLD